MGDANGYLSGIGIQKGSDLHEAQGSEYDLLYLSGEAARDMLGNSIEQDTRRAALPRRIVINRRAEDEHDAYESVQAVTRESIQLSSTDSRETSQKKVLDIYDEWIHFLKDRRFPGEDRQLQVSFYFDDLRKAADSWGLSDGLYLSSFINFNAYKGDIHNNAVPEAKSNSFRNICLWRHKSVEEIVNEIKPIIYYREQSYGNPLFSYISSLNPDSQPFQCSYLIRQIVEMALCRVVVVDERVSQTVAAETSQEASKNSGSISGTMSHELAWGGIWVVGRVRIRIKSGGKFETYKFSIGEEQRRADFIVGAKPSQENGLVTLSLDIDPSKEEFGITIDYPGNIDSLPPPPEQVEIMSLHQSIFDTVLEYPFSTILSSEYGEYKEEVGENLVWRIKPSVLSTCFHSGRGHPQDRLPKNAPYLDYSSLQVHLLNQPSKFFFVQQAFASNNTKK